jgi:hypothetical protein
VSLAHGGPGRVHDGQAESQEGGDEDQREQTGEQAFELTFERLPGRTEGLEVEPERVNGMEEAA